MPTPAEMAPVPSPDALLPGATARGLPTDLQVLSLEQLGRELRCLQPPPAYRLSLDSGIAYKNVRRALEHPLGMRLDTWRKLLRSLGLQALAIAPGHGATPGGPAPATRGARVAAAGLDATDGALAAESAVDAAAWARSEAKRPNVDAAAWARTEARSLNSATWAHSPATGVDAGGVRHLRQQCGWSRRAVARRAGLALEAIAALEEGRGLVGSLARALAALDFELVVALPAGRATLRDVWAERAGRCLEAPAHYPPAPARRQRPTSAPASHRRRQWPAAAHG